MKLVAPWVVCHGGRWVGCERCLCLMELRMSDPPYAIREHMRAIIYAHSRCLPTE